LNIAADPPPEGYVLRLYDVSTRAVLSEFRGMSTDPNTAAISDDGMWVASTPDPADVYEEKPTPIILWNAQTGNIASRLEGHRSYLTSLRFSPDGRLLASASEDNTVAYGLRQPQENRREGDGALAEAISFSADLTAARVGQYRRNHSHLGSHTGCLFKKLAGKPATGILAVAFFTRWSPLASASGETVRAGDAAREAHPPSSGHSHGGNAHISSFRAPPHVSRSGIAKESTRPSRTVG
jgi:hypothetical protein